MAKSIISDPYLNDIMFTFVSWMLEEGKELKSDLLVCIKISDIHCQNNDCGLYGLHRFVYLGLSHY